MRISKLLDSPLLIDQRMVFTIHDQFKCTLQVEKLVKEPDFLIRTPHLYSHIKQQPNLEIGLAVTIEIIAKSRLR